MKQLVFNFPETIFAQKNTPEEQISHLRSELDEATYEFVFDNIPLATMECLDAYHSAETLLMILVKEHGQEKVLKAMEVIIKKNSKRGYYLCESDSNKEGQASV